MQTTTREHLTLAATALAFTVAILFRGPGDNLPLLAYSSLFLLTAIWIQFGFRGSRIQICWGIPHTVAVSYIIWMGLAINWSTLPENSFFMFWVLASMPLVFVLVSQMNDRMWSRLFLLLQVAALLSALWGISEFINLKRRANGPLIDPNAWAAMHNIFFFAVLFRYLVQKESSWLQNRAQEVALLLFAAALFCAYSRAGTVVWLLIFLTSSMVVLAARQGGKKMLLAGMLALLSYSMVHGYASQAEASHAEGYTLNVKDKAWSLRFAQWQSAWQVYREHPYTGSGLGTFKVQYPLHRTDADLSTLGNYVHNDYLQFLQEGGPIQLVFLLSLLCFLGWLFVTRLVLLVKGSRSPVHLEMVGLILAMGTALTHALLTFTLLQMLIEFLLGLLLARICRLAFPQQQTTWQNPRPQFTAIALGLLLYMPWSVLAMDSLSSALIYKHKWIPFADSIREDELRMYRTLDWLVTLRPGYAINHIALATIYRRKKDQQTDPEAIKSLAITSAILYRRGLDVNPWLHMIYIYYADLLDEHPEIGIELELVDDPIAILQTAIDLAPVYLEPYLALAARYERRGDAEMAFKLLKEQALPWVDLRHWNYEDSQVPFLRKLLELSEQFGDRELTEHLRQRLASSPASD
ncbi:MAG: O-antigen ligase family protein [Pseudomonadales bacterium]|nr:O-antigen ligase family protein [Pseudomonadales bacterium]